MGSDSDEKNDGTALADQLWLERSAKLPGHFSVRLFPFGNLGLSLDQITAHIAGDRRRHLERRQGRVLTEAERADIANDISHQVLASLRRIEALAAENAADPFQNRPRNRYRMAQMLRLAAGVLAAGGGRPTKVIAGLVYIDFGLAREQLAPLHRKLRTVRNPDTAWQWLQQNDSALSDEIVARGFKARWFATRSQPTLDRMAAELISDHHPGVSLSTLIRYGRRRPLK